MAKQKMSSDSNVPEAIYSQARGDIGWGLDRRRRSECPVAQKSRSIKAIVLLPPNFVVDDVSTGKAVGHTEVLRRDQMVGVADPICCSSNMSNIDHDCGQSSSSVRLRMDVTLEAAHIARAVGFPTAVDQDQLWSYVVAESTEILSPLATIVSAAAMHCG